MKKTSPVRIETERLVLRLPDPTEASAVLAFFEQNRDHLDRWTQPWPEGFFTEGYWSRQLATNRVDLEQDRALRLFLYRRQDLETGRGVEVQPIGNSNFSQIFRGRFCACILGYNLGASHQGRGYMTEALTAACSHAFEELGLHRIMANYVPTNEPSGRLLRRLGFVVEGYARDYLFVGDRWADHVLTALTSPDPSDPVL